MTLHDNHKTWLIERGIDPVLAEKLGLSTEFKHSAAWLAVPYREGGETINHKYRLTSEKRHMMDADAPLALWNADILNDPKVREGHAPVVITEGEWDAIAVIQAGHPYVVSVPNGAPSSETEDLNTATRYDWVDRHAEALSKVKRFVIAADRDQAGDNLRQDLIGLLGAYRCSFVEYIDGCKDLNEVLEWAGPEAVVEAITTAKECPVKGLFKLSDFPEQQEVRRYDVGVVPINSMIHIVPGTLTLLTGYANGGKSTLMNSIIANTLERHFPVCVASFETDVKPILRDGLRAAMLGCAKAEIRHHPDLEHVDRVLDDRLHIISQSVDEDHEFTLDTFLETCRAAVMRGAKMIVLDPWNELEHKRRRDESETDYIGRALRAIKRFAKQTNTAFWIVAHPKMPSEGPRKPPSLYNISGCHSEDTEVLTKRGWITHDQVTHDDEVACFDPADSALTYQRPTRIIRQPFDGDLYRFKGYGFDQCVTPDHRMVVKPMWPEPVGTQKETSIGRPTRWPKDEWSFCEAQDLPSAPFNIPLAGQLKDERCGECSPLMAQLAGWFVSEGTWMSAGVGLSQAADTDGARKIEALLNAMEIPFSVTLNKPGGKGGTLPCNTYYIGVTGARDTVEWLRSNCGKGSANKRIPDAIVSGPDEVKRAFLQAYLDGDGHLSDNGTYCATTTSHRLRDQLQAMAIELGFCCCWSSRKPQSERHSPSWHLTFGREGRSETSVRMYRSMARVPYCGHVWCLTVPTGAYVTRRNGKASISGNSSNWANKADYGLTYHRPKFNENKAQILVTKVRMGLPGRRDEVEVEFDADTSSFRRYENEYA